jgi:hypothetical protein
MMSNKIKLIKNIKIYFVMNFKEILLQMESKVFLLPPYFERIYEMYLNDNYMSTYDGTGGTKNGYINHRLMDKYIFSTKYPWIYKFIMGRGIIIDLICDNCFDSVCKYKATCTFPCESYYYSGVYIEYNIPYRNYNYNHKRRYIKQELNKIIKIHLKKVKELEEITKINETARVIQKGCENWLWKPITRDGKLGINARLGLKECVKIGILDTFC